LGDISRRGKRSAALKIKRERARKRPVLKKRVAHGRTLTQGSIKKKGKKIGGVLAGVNPKRSEQRKKKTKGRLKRYFNSPGGCKSQKSHASPRGERSSFQRVGFQGARGGGGERGKMLKARFRSRWDITKLNTGAGELLRSQGEELVGARGKGQNEAGGRGAAGEIVTRNFESEIFGLPTKEENTLLVGGD